MHEPLKLKRGSRSPSPVFIGLLFYCSFLLVLVCMHKNIPNRRICAYILRVRIVDLLYMCVVMRCISSYKFAGVDAGTTYSLS